MAFCTPLLVVGLGEVAGIGVSVAVPGLAVACEGVLRSHPTARPSNNKQTMRIFTLFIASMVLLSHKANLGEAVHRCLLLAKFLHVNPLITSMDVFSPDGFPMN